MRQPESIARVAALFIVAAVALILGLALVAHVGEYLAHIAAVTHKG